MLRQLNRAERLGSIKNARRNGQCCDAPHPRIGSFMGTAAVTARNVRPVGRQAGDRLPDPALALMGERSQRCTAWRPAHHSVSTRRSMQ